MTALTSSDHAGPAQAATQASTLQLAWLTKHLALISIGVATVAGLGLRLLAARGDLWLDELWSLDLVSHVTSPDQVFWKISHDNNHYLNSLWMTLVGQNGTPLTYRLPSIVFSTLAILAAARIGWRVNPPAGVAAACLAACSYPFVLYGSEARGYAGLILAVIIATDITRTLVDQACARTASDAALRKRWPLALALGFGTCSHLTMMAGAAILGLAAVLRLKSAGFTLVKAFDRALDLFRPSLLVLLPIIACLGIGILVQGQFTIGGNVPFSVANVVTGFGGLLAAFLGLLSVVPPIVAVVVTALIVPAAFALGWLDRRWIMLAIVALVVWPGLILLGHVRNTEYARYFLVAGLVLPIFLAEIAGRLWAAGGFHRWMGVAGIMAVCAGQGPDCLRLLTDHRGSPGIAVALMAADGPTTYRARNAPITEPVVETYAVKQGLSITVADPADLCRKPAEWVVYDSDFGEDVPTQPQLGPANCRVGYALVAAYPAPRWSGRSWSLFRRLR